MRMQDEKESMIFHSFSLAFFLWQSLKKETPKKKKKMRTHVNRNWYVSDASTHFLV